MTAALLSVLAACSSSRAVRPAVAPVPESSGASSAGRRPIGPTPAHIGPLDARVTAADLDALWERQLMVPVEGIPRGAIRDNYTAKRAAGIHRALDILAPRYTAVVASDDLVIGRLFSGPVGGIVIYASDPEQRFVYYYAHLERYRTALAVGDRVAKGSVIGYVGTTGNAPPDTPHLHFQVMKRAVGRAWWDGPAINPFSFFALDALRP
jgi:murein DD-endopeptidase MepM/ murein hydrolase activator NlpD